MQVKRKPPFFKQFTRLRFNIQNRPKFFRFKKKKWQNFKFHNLRRLKFFKRYRFVDQNRYYVSKFFNRKNSFKNRFSKNLINQKLLNLFYGTLKKKVLKRELLSRHRAQQNYLGYLDSKTSPIFKRLESRLDVIIYRAGFSSSIKKARQYILHGHITVNKKIIKKNSFKVSFFDTISIQKNAKSRKIVKENLQYYHHWPLPPKYLAINYKTLQIIMLPWRTGDLRWFFNYQLNLDKVVHFSRFN